AGGGGSSSHHRAAAPNPGPAPEPTPEPEPQPEPDMLIVRGKVTAGPVTNATVVVYGSDGQVLGQAPVGEDGRFEMRAQSSYRGPILLQVIDANGPDGNYLDETLNTLLNLAVAMRSLDSVPESGEVE